MLHFAPSALHVRRSLTWADGPGYYISRPWRWDPHSLRPFQSGMGSGSLLKGDFEIDAECGLFGGYIVTKIHQLFYKRTAWHFRVAVITTVLSFHR